MSIDSLDLSASLNGERSALADEGFQPTRIDRRSFLYRFGLVAGATAAAGTALPSVAYAAPPAAPLGV